jgi:hypothetical protein
MRVRGFTLLVLASLTLGTAACSDSSPTSPTVNLAGSYTLVSLAAKVQGQTVPVDGASGTLVLTATQYTLSLTVPGQGTLDDTGTYSVSGSTWSQSSTTTGQATGTYSVNGTQLTVDATSQGTETISVWQKQ